MSAQLKVRVRFAPSPTGALHLGNARTGLFNYLYARRHGGTFVLRIEDTDRARSSQELERGIIDNLAWLGMIPDEGVEHGGAHGPYRQTERTEIYARYINQLIEQGDAYPCFCTTEELETERQAAQKEGRAYQYSGRCRDLIPEQRTGFETEGRKPAIRFRVPDEGEIAFADEIRGPISFQLRDIGDFVIARSDGSPLYNIANVVDDALMEITHVIRGEEFISTTPSQILIGRALDFEIPKFVHLPLLLSPSGGKLSKREASVAVEDYRPDGYLPEAVINFLALLGWSPPGESDFFALGELEKVFDLDHVQKAGAQVDFEKLKHLNGRHIRAKTPEQLADLLLASEFIPKEWGSDRELLIRAVATVQERLTTLKDTEPFLRFYFTAPTASTPEKLGKLPSSELKSHLEEVVELLKRADFSDQAGLEQALHSLLKRQGLGPRDLFPALRLILTGEQASPGIHEVLWALGREESLKRLADAVKTLTQA